MVDPARACVTGQGGRVTTRLKSTPSGSRPSSASFSRWEASDSAANSRRATGASDHAAFEQLVPCSQAASSASGRRRAHASRSRRWPRVLARAWRRGRGRTGTVAGARARRARALSRRSQRARGWPDSDPSPGAMKTLPRPEHGVRERLVRIARASHRGACRSGRGRAGGRDRPPARHARAQRRAPRRALRRGPRAGRG